MSSILEHLYSLSDLIKETTAKSKKSIQLLEEEGAIGETKPGEIIKLPAWQMDLLVKMKLAELKVEPVSLETLYRVLSLEEFKKFKLHGLPKDFYIRCKAMMNVDFKRKNKFKGLLKSLMTLRLQKILKMAAKCLDDPKEREKMTFEEEIIFDVVRNFINNWKEHILSCEDKK